MVMPGAQKKQKTIFDLIDKGTAQDFADYIAEHPESIEAFGTQYKCTPLIWAAYTGKAECLKLLIKAGANLDSQDKDLDTALSSASKMGHGECVNLLLEAGADTKIITAGGKTAEEHAESQHIRNIFIKAFCGRFIKESNTIVFINELVESCDLTIKTIYNFKAATITTQGKDNDGQSLFVQEFNLRSPQKQLTQAAQFLKQQGGDLCGFKLPAVL
jgi:hypothetical protein